LDYSRIVGETVAGGGDLDDCLRVIEGLSDDLLEFLEF